MDLLIILTYAGLCVVVFKAFRIPLTKWTVPTAILGGIVILGTLLMLMNYNHPYGKYAKEVFVSVPIVPAVKGIVVSVDAEPNTPLKKGDLLFRIDPKPFALTVAKTKAQLVEAEQAVKQTLAQMEAATARVKKAEADRDRTKQSFERYVAGNRAGGAKIFSEQEVENRRQLYLASEATLEAVRADELRARLAYESQIDGVNTRVAQLQAQLEAAEYDLERTEVRAPEIGFVTQVALRPGVMATNLPLRPAMVFIPNQRRQIAASFWQNSLSRMKPGFEAEVIFDAVPGHVFKGQLKSVLPAMSEGDIQATGNLVSASRVATHGRALGLIELEENLNDYGLPFGVQGKAAVYSDQFTHVSVMRRILLRMLGWINYIFPMK
ncbi:MAG: HlyD family secretion protein [Gammaproteobacteria bacterium]|nr:HlyD family secretion protein [Gammaproteobacteria bacterium]MCP5407450.1 HlyD family secretion protein [Chromatiaceae bacterium]MCP5443921.1 HlyD family secretion protein [Chromatiaceae bacterium]